MSLEQAILDRLEKRNAQIAQLQSTIQALERAADSQREHAMLERGRLVDENEKLAAQIDDSDVIERRERLIKSLNDEITKRDHELRAHEKELAESREEIRKLRAEVPLESTREGLKNAVAKLQEVTTEKDRMRLQLENARADLKQVLIERDSLGLMAADRALEIRKLMDGHAEDMKAQAELLSKYESLLTKTTDLGSYAMTLGRKEGEPLEMFMERQALRVAALESKAGPSIETQAKEIARLNAKVAELEAQSGKIGYAAKREHEEAVTAARENGIHKGESLSGFIWRQCESLRKSQAENAPLNKVFIAICKQRGNLNEEIIYRAVDEASDAIKKLTA